MAINISKGQKIDLRKQTGSTLANLRIGLGWDAVPSAQGGGEADLDVSIAGIIPNPHWNPTMPVGAAITDSILNTKEMIDEEEFVFYNKLQNNDGTITHSGDNRTGSGEGDDETVKVKLSQIDATKYAKYLIIITIDNSEGTNYNFGDVENCYCKVYDEDQNDKELLNFDLQFDENSSIANAIVVASLINRNGNWFFSADAKPFPGGLAGVLEAYGQKPQVA